MAYPAFDYISPNDYLAMEVRANEKHEYFDGRIYNMGGASFDHNYIVADLTRKMNVFLDGKECHVYGSDLRVTTPQFDSFMYPDLTIVCEEIKSKENTFDTIINPAAIIEVMSPSTMGYDLAFKFHYYKQILSLKEYILIDSTRYFIQINRRAADNTWGEPVNIEDVDGSFLINTIGMDVALKDIYNRVSFKHTI